MQVLGCLKGPTRASVVLPDRGLTDVDEGMWLMSGTDVVSTGRAQGPSRRLPVLLAVAGTLALLLIRPAGGPGLRAPRADIPDWRTACQGEQPFHITACYPIRPNDLRDITSVLMFRDTPADRPHVTLADQAAVGAIWGLAYSEVEGAVYAAAYHKRLVGFGPGGPGAIYRIDLGTGAVTLFATVPNAGPDRHERSLTGPRQDRGAAAWVGKTSLGDLDLSEDGRELYVSNLSDRQIYRYALPDGQLLGSFAHGAAAEPWAAEARPFGLEMAGGRLFHGVVHSAELSQKPADLRAYVYVSAPDGSDLRLAASVGLDGPRGLIEEPMWRQRAELRWQPWTGRFVAPSPPQTYTIYPMPLLSDIELDTEGRLIIGLKDRLADMLLLPGVTIAEEGYPLGAGDVLRADPEGDGWRFLDGSAHPFDDSIRFASHSALGALALGHHRNQLGITALNTTEQYTGFPSPFYGAIYWLDPAGGNKLSQEGICPGYVHRGAQGPSLVRRALADNEWTPQTMHLGDLEELCALLPTATATDTVRPTASPSATAPPSASPSRQPSATVSASPTATPSPTRGPRDIYLPLLLRESCAPEVQQVDVVLLMDASTSMLAPSGLGGSKLDAARAAATAFLAALATERGDQAGLVSFNSQAHLLQGLTGNRAAVEQAFERLEVAQLTRIDLGIVTAAEELVGPRARPGNAPTLILLTDGRANPVGPEVAEARAREAKAAGITLFTIGLGEDVDLGSLTRMASSPAHVHHAPSAAELAAIYRGIARVLPCPEEAFWGRRR